MTLQMPQLRTLHHPASAGPAEVAMYPDTVDGACLAAVRRLPPPTVIQRCVDADLTADELVDRVARVSSALTTGGVGRGDVVSLKSRRDSWLLPVLIGVMTAGAAYHIIPFNSPAAVEDAALDTLVPAAVVVWDDLAPASWPAGDALALGDDVRILFRAGRGVTATPTDRLPEDTCYVCATSGTSGRPKCTAVPHRAVLAFLAAAPAVIRLDPTDVVAARSSAAFDLSVWELFGSLLAGATTVLVPEAVAADTPRLHATLRDHGCTVLSTTPSAAYQLGAYDALEGGGLSLRRLLVGGEAANGTRLQDVLSAPSFSRCRLDNWYGPTECTVSVTGGELTADRLHELDLTIGPAMPGVGLTVTDEYGASATVGELVVTGDQLAHGYLGSPRATAAAFVPGPGGTRAYRTGDLVRMDAQGWVTYLGRGDSQVQLRGYRLELTEVERALAGQPGVRWCHAGVGGTQEDVLLAWVAVHPGATFDRAEILRDLHTRLPRHAVPAALIQVEEIPFSEGQKLAAHLLPAPSTADFAAVADRPSPPATETESRLLEIWRALLQIEDIGTTHHFFEIGGHSLLAARLLSTMRREFGIRLTLADVMQNLTIRDLGRLIDSHITTSNTTLPTR